MEFTVYILRTSANTLYTGYTNDLEARLKTHASHTHRGSKYMNSFASFSLVYTERFTTKSDAMRREAALKRLTKFAKEQLIREGHLSRRKV